MSNVIDLLELKYDWFSLYYVYSLIVLQIVNALLVINYMIFNKTFINPLYIKQFNNIIQIIICVVLIIKFNPFRTHMFKPNDAKLITSSAIFLLINLGVSEYITNAIQNVKKKVKFVINHNDESV
jgi:hypothetical protein